MSRKSTILRVSSKRSGFIIAESVVACLIAGLFLAAVFSSLFTAAVLVRRNDKALKLVRLKREMATESSISDRKIGHSGVGAAARNVTKTGHDAVLAAGVHAAKRSKAVVWPKR